MTPDMLHQDHNKATQQLKVNGKRSPSRHTRYLHMQYFYITNQVEAEWVLIQNHPTEVKITNILHHTTSRRPIPPPLCPPDKLRHRYPTTNTNCPACRTHSHKDTLDVPKNKMSIAHTPPKPWSTGPGSINAMATEVC
jgi:hypothetical protein